MKLSHLTLGAMLIASSVALSQQEPKRPKQDATKRKKVETQQKKVKKDSTKTSIKAQPKVTHDYCPPCGMG